MPKFLVENLSGKDLSLGIEPWADVEVLRPDAHAEFEYEHPAEISFSVMEDGTASVYVVSENIVVAANGRKKTFKL